MCFPTSIDECPKHCLYHSENIENRFPTACTSTDLMKSNKLRKMCVHTYVARCPFGSTHRKAVQHQQQKQHLLQQHSGADREKKRERESCKRNTEYKCLHIASVYIVTIHIHNHTRARGHNNRPVKFF